MFKQIMFDGFKAIELNTPALKLVAVYGTGPRIAFIGKPSGENILFWDHARKYARGQWNLRGGHRVWIARPGADESEETYSPDNAEATLEVGADNFKITTPVDAFNGTRRGFSIKVLSDNKLEVDNFIINAGDMLYSASIWGLTCTLPTRDTRYAFTLGDGSDWDSCTYVAFNKWAGHGKGGFNDPQFSFTKDLLLVTPAGVENKRMLQSAKGIMAMDDPKRGFTFLKKNSYDPAGRYPMGTNQAVYVGPDNFMVEMETMGAEANLKPGATLSSKEVWMLTPSIGLDSAAKLEAQF